MPTVQAGVIINRAATTLLDLSHTAWTQAELFDYLTAAQRIVCQLKADAYTKLASVPLVAGVDQVLPADGISVVSAYRNTTSKRAVKQVGLDNMNAANPNWAAETRQREVREVIADQRQPFRFQVYPPNDGTGALDMVYGAAPPAIAALTDVISVADTYEPALWQGVLFGAYSKNSRQQDLTKAAAALQAMNAMVTGKTATIKLNAPDLKQSEQAQS